jgi:hypothetical protein
MWLDRPTGHTLRCDSSVKSYELSALTLNFCVHVIADGNSVHKWLALTFWGALV